MREELAGHWYRVAEMNRWLCPAMFRYFAIAPSSIYCKTEAAKSRDHKWQ
jgi:hypothetical protein